MSGATKKNCIDVAQKIKNVTTIQPINSTSEYLSKENKNTNSQRYDCCSIIYNNQAMDATWEFTNKWKDKEDVIYNPPHIYEDDVICDIYMYEGVVCIYEDVIYVYTYMHIYGLSRRYPVMKK